MHRRRGHERGAAAVEMALLLPLLIIIAFGVIDFGRAFNAQVTLTQAAREGSRLAAVCNSSTPSTCGTVATRTASAATNLSGVTSTITTCAANAPVTADAVVTVQWTMHFSTPLTGLIPGFTSSRVLTGRGRMPCQ